MISKLHESLEAKSRKMKWFLSSFTWYDKFYDLRCFLGEIIFAEISENLEAPKRKFTDGETLSRGSQDERKQNKFIRRFYISDARRNEEHRRDGWWKMLVWRRKKKQSELYETSWTFSSCRSFKQSCGTSACKCLLQRRCRASWRKWDETFLL